MLDCRHYVSLDNELKPIVCNALLERPKQPTSLAKGLPIAQLEDLEEGNEISYYYRRGKKSGGGNEKSDDNDDSDDREQEVDNNDNNDEEIIVWPDCFADIYMMRPETETVEKKSAFEFVMKCEVVYKNPQPNENSESDDTQSSKRYKGGILDFTDQHPSKGRAHVRELKHERIPIIYSKYEYTNISLLELMMTVVPATGVYARDCGRDCGRGPSRSDHSRARRGVVAVPPPPTQGGRAERLLVSGGVS